MVSRDVYANVKPNVSEKRQLLVGKFVVPVIALMALAFAELQLDLIAVLSVAASSGLVAMVPALIGAFYWKRGTGVGALVSVVGTSAFVLLMYATGNSLLGLPAGVWGIVVASVLFVGVSLATKPHQATTDAFFAAISEELSKKRSTTTDQATKEAAA